jgi:hypothetical protein
MPMQVTVHLPDEIAKQLGDTAVIPRAFLEAVAAEGYRAHKLSRHQVSQLLDLDYWKTEEFLNQHEAKRPYTLADLQIDRQSLAGLPEK